MAIRQIRLLGSEVTLSTASTIGDAECVRLFNGNSVAAGTVNVITQKRLQDTTKPFHAVDNPYNITVGTISLYPQQEIILDKRSNDTLEATNASCLAVSIFDKIN